ncbi:zinc finger protein with KRAB and SCAN domains 8-like [Hemibagrus wyckioides]|uniref:zinc finger protein with KRAB and SCAN domains 8-like n=1 Tax=Hemibagrus wyckioides TaxID=337641 RepID=UPI00266CEA78|nr:zinc finger protein with KRAB and SCAN domains 8-like [Hemibagrus wyckioides]
MKKLHVTIQNGGPIQLAKCVQCCTKYHCPFCKPEIFKPTVKSKVRKHIKAHEKRAVKFKEYAIFKCGLNCKAVSHFHCPKCSKLVEKKNKFLEHLVKCVGTVAHEDRENLFPLKEEPDLRNMSIKEDVDSYCMSEEQESHSAVVRGEELHVSIQTGGPIQLAKCVQCCTKYHCPFCKPDVFKPTVESRVRKHIKAHEKRAVKFKGFVIFKCGLNCRPVSHFHCPKCCKLLEKKNRFVDHLNKCVGTVTGEGGRPVKQEADSHHVPEGEENIQVPETKDFRLEVESSPALPVQSEVVSFPQSDHKPAFTDLHNSASSCTFANPRMSRKRRSWKMPFVEENIPESLSTCSKVEEKSWREAVKSLQTYQETSIFKSSEVMVNTHCLLELFQFCWLCQKECCITIKGSERLFSVTQDCQSCSFHRDWRSHPRSAEPTQTFHTETEHEEVEEVVVQIASSDNECSEQVFIKKDGSYLHSDVEKASLHEEEMKKKRKRKFKSKDSSDEWEPCLNEEVTDSELSMDEDMFTVLKEDGQGKLVVWCTQCETEASLSCSVHRHKKVFCCAQCSAGDIQTHHIETLPVRFDDMASFQKHAEQEHGSKPVYDLCQDCGKFAVADPESRGLKKHKCEHKSKFVVCPECGKRFLTEAGLKSHRTRLHSDYDHPCKYCLKVFKIRSAKLDHEQTHPKANRPYSCPHCPEKFSSIHKRNKHVITSHRGPYKYVCDVCGKGFNDINRLRRHELIHSGEKPFKCQVCERSFNQMENLTSHMRVHTGEKPFRCEQCGESFSYNVCLKNHKQRHHDSRV